MTLLERFIRDCNKGYHEPERRGVSKGHEIGPSRGRFNATLYSLYNLNKKEVAERANISHAFLRNLWTEEPFKDKYAETVDLFTDFYLYSYLTDGCIVKLPGITYPDCEVVDERRVRIPESVEEAFSDSCNYSPLVKGFMVDDISKYIEKMGIQRWANSGQRLSSMMLLWNEPALNKTIFQTILRLHNELIKNTLELQRIPVSVKDDIYMCCQFVDKVAKTL